MSDALYIQSLDDNSLGLRASLVYRSNTQENNLLGLTGSGDPVNPPVSAALHELFSTAKLYVGD